MWLGWFLAALLRDFAAVAETRGDTERADALAQRAGGCSRRRWTQAWDGDWYRRAYFDDGTPLGSAQLPECRIDSISQSWAVLSGVAPRARAERAMDAVRVQLVRRDARVILLLTPPFDRSNAGSRLHQGLPPGHPRERRPVHARRASGR